MAKGKIPRRWIWPDLAPEGWAEEVGVHPLLAQVLYGRGIRSVEAARKFLREGEGEQGERLRDLDRAVDLLLRSIRWGDRIAVYGDFDVDGVTGTALLTTVLRGLGASVVPYIPHRVREGYGVNLGALRELYRQGCRVVVTVDCGIRDVEVIDRARRGLAIVVVDHHVPGEVLPPAVAVIDPKREEAGASRVLAGVGVAYRLAQALLREAPAWGISPEIGEEELLDLVALGTVADVVPLVGENRHLVRKGLERINRAPRVGVRALLSVARLRGMVRAVDVAFVLAPRLNAAGRLDDARLSLELLMCEEERRALRLAEELERRNRERQAMTARGVRRAEELAGAEMTDRPLLFAADAEFHRGVVGLIAGRLTEAYYRPAVVVAQGEQFSHGSCRSIPEFHITWALDACGDLLERYGGHAEAAGFTVRTERLEALRERLIDLAADRLAGVPLQPSLAIDAVTSLAALDMEAYEALQALEPCGEGNPEPLICSRGVEVRDVRLVGGEGSHMRMILGGEGVYREAIAFRWEGRVPGVGERVDVVYTLEVNEWGGQRSLQLRIEDLRSAEEG